MGLFSPPEVSIQGPTQLIEGQNATWTANASSDNSSNFSYKWYKSDYPAGASVLVSTTDQYATVADKSFSLLLQVTYAGSEAGQATITVMVLQDGFD